MSIVLVIDKKAPILKELTAEQVCDELHLAIMNSSSNVAVFLHQPKYQGICTKSVFSFISDLERGNISLDTHIMFEFKSDDAGFWVAGTPYLCHHPAYVAPEYAHLFSAKGKSHAPQ